MFLHLGEQKEIVNILIVFRLEHQSALRATAASVGVHLAKLSGAGAPRWGWHLFRSFVAMEFSGVGVMPLLSSKIAEQTRKHGRVWRLITVISQSFTISVDRIPNWKRVEGQIRAQHLFLIGS